MKLIKIAHECPKSIFKKVQGWTDYDYALVHLFEEDPEYLKLFKDAVLRGREVILDNSIFELGEAFDPEKFVYWINELKPTWYIVPDVLDDAEGTTLNMENWIQHWKPKVTAPSKMIGVVQGKEYNELTDCYQYMCNVAKVDKVAISFDSICYRDLVPHPDKLMSWMLGRVTFLSCLIQDGYIRRDIPHHLLGCALPGEGIFYPWDQFPFIDSIDTSNPVVHGMERFAYKGPLGMQWKSNKKLYTLMNEEVTLEQWTLIVKNIQDFKRLWRGNYGI